MQRGVISHLHAFLTDANLSLHDEIHQLTSSEDAATAFVQNRNIVKSALMCSYSTTMSLTTCPSSKSPDLSIWKCSVKFGKRKYNRGAYREGMWVLGGVDRNTGNCFLLPCPGNGRGANLLLPLIERWVLPGLVVYTDEWGAYNDVTRRGYTTTQ